MANVTSCKVFIKSPEDVAEDFIAATIDNDLNKMQKLFVKSDTCDFETNQRYMANLVLKTQKIQTQKKAKKLKVKSIEYSIDMSAVKVLVKVYLDNNSSNNCNVTCCLSSINNRWYVDSLDFN